MGLFFFGFSSKGEKGMLTRSGRTLGQVRLEGGLLLAALTAFCCQTRQQLLLPCASKHMVGFGFKLV